ncbi:hypothetical protein NEHOM01_2322 [Nematocida homosporus]|uniref:uncharacterized protein n=1 Tax=Nematocida homosporus TaxID=1912981 RepID=UPI00221FECB5|nr:uncharacterized protein NEHOM01_2322 [Nematocida homosporus]KAI5187722.1 hypothetical protein NEHOM01_2322 [Nematocida homosporus]
MPSCLSIFLFVKNTTLSLLMKNFPSLHAQRNLKCPLKPSKPTPTHYQLNAIPIQWVLVILLGLLNGIGADSSLLVYPITPPTLHTIGFTWNMSVDLKITPFSSSPLLESASPAIGTSSQLASTKDKITNWVVECPGETVTFSLPANLNNTLANLVLAHLQTIVVIKTKDAYVQYTKRCQIDHLLAMQILSRVVNLFDCHNLHLDLMPGLGISQPNPNPCDYTICHKEAQKTFDRIDYKVLCTLTSEYDMNAVFTEFLRNKVFLLRPISGIKIPDGHCCNPAFLSRLPLTNNYAIFLRPTWNDGTTSKLNFGFLQTSPPMCNKIHVRCSESLYDRLAGLEHARVKYPRLILETTWKAIINDSTFNRTPPQTMVDISTILVLDVDLLAIAQITDASTITQPARPWIEANKLICELNCYVPCKSISCYQGAFTPTAFAKYGVLVKQVEVRYSKDPREDLSTSLSLLVPRMQTHYELNSIQCCGDALSGSFERIKDPVDITVEVEDGHFAYSYFCQHLRYTIINIAGREEPSPTDAYQCTQILLRFRNINTRELRISNVHGSINLAPKCYRTPLTRDFGKCKLKANKLILANTTPDLIDWILYNYELVCPIEIYLINHHLTNLAIAKVLARKEARNISKLVIVGLRGLAEFEPPSQPSRTNKFPLFKYVLSSEENDFAQELALHKLVLLPEDIDVDSQWVSSGLQFIRAHGGQVLSSPVEEYVSTSLAQSNSANPMDTTGTTPYNTTLAAFSSTLRAIKAFTMRCLSCPAEEDVPTSLSQANLTNSLDTTGITLYNITLPFLQADLIKYQANITAGTNKESVERLFLCFAKTQLLTEADLATIIRWVGYRFKDILALHLIKAVLSEEEQKIIIKRNYWIRTQPSLKTIQISNTQPNTKTSHIQLVLKPYHTRLLLSVSLDPSKTIKVPLPLLDLLVKHINAPNDTLTKLIQNIPSLNAAIEDLTKLKQLNTNDTPKQVNCEYKNKDTQLDKLSCLHCQKALYTPQTQTQTKDNNSNGKQPTQTATSLYKFTTLCYFPCEHFLCDLCADQKLNYKCSVCLNSLPSEEIYRIVPLSPAQIILVNDHTKNTATAHNWLKSMEFPDEYIYFCVSHKDMAGLDRDGSMSAIIAPFYSIHII